MKITSLLLTGLALLSCSRHQKSPDSFPSFDIAEEDMIPYEGILPSADGLPAHTELYLRPGPPGMDGDYELHESMNLVNVSVGASSRGKYTVLLAPAGGRIIQLKSCSLVQRPARENEWLPAERAGRDLYLRGTDGNELALVDNNFQQIDARYALIRRSALFTAEGYITVYDDSTAEFYERNTRKKWPLAQYGCYTQAVRKYHSSAKEKFEGIYLKALSYTVSCRSDQGEPFDAVVFKKILDMDTVVASQ